MSYMDRLNGTARTHAPVVKAATITDARSAQGWARARAVVDAEDDAGFREARALMFQRTGVCG